MNRDRSYYRKQRMRVIHCKETILRQLGGEENVLAWEHGAAGRLSKGKIHCSCWMCRSKSYDEPQVRDRLPASMWNTFLFMRGYEIVFADARVWSLPCSCFIHSFFRSKARASRNSPVRMLALPQVRKRRNPKSFLSRAKAPSTRRFSGEQAPFQGHMLCSQCGPPAFEISLSTSGRSWWAL